MKTRTLLGLLLFLLITLCACSAQNESDVSADDLKKAQAIAVTDADGNLLQTITSNADIEAFVTALDIDHWSLADIPQDANPLATFGFSQEKTIHFGEKANDGQLYDIGTLSLFDAPYLRMTILGFTFDFSIPDAAYDYLCGMLS